jgi:hypothetical protein
VESIPKHIYLHIHVLCQFLLPAVLKIQKSARVSLDRPVENVHHSVGKISVVIFIGLDNGWYIGVGGALE